jgi:hypothetical protein
VFGKGIGQPTVLLVAHRGRPGPFERLAWSAEPTPAQVVSAVGGRSPHIARQWRADPPATTGERWPQQLRERRSAGRARTAPRLGEHFAVNQGVVPGPARATSKAVARLLRERGGAPTPASIRAWACQRGFTIGEGVFVLDGDAAARLLADGVPDALFRPFARPRAILGTGCPRDTGERLLYLTAATCPDVDEWPALQRHLARFRPLLERRRETRLGLRAWHLLHWPRQEALFLQPRVLVPRQCRAPVAAYCNRPLFVDLGCNVITGTDAASLRQLAEYLNSVQVADWLRTHGKHKADIQQIDARILKEIPTMNIG